jgi:hypothetical protein
LALRETGLKKLCVPPRDKIAAPFTFFIDRSCGRKSFPEAVRAAAQPGEIVIVHDEHFSQNAPDEQWLKHVGTCQWIAFTQDDLIRHRPTELNALLQAKSAVFILTGANLNAEKMALLVTSCLPAVRTAVRRFDVAIVGTVQTDGGVKVTYARGEKLVPTVRISKR